MRPSFFRAAVPLLLGLCVFAAAPASAAETVLQTKCVTAATKAMHEADLARLEKDVAPYATDPAAAATVQKYRDGITIAWEAMEQPYCGTGSPGFASSKKSYIKTVERSRTAFFANIKKPTTSLATIPSTPAPAPVVAPKPVVKPVAVAALSSAFVPRGLVQGMRSEGVRELQKRLLAHFKMTIDEATNATGFFGTKTRDLVIKFQIEKAFIASADDDAAGLVGPKTTAAINAL